MTQKKYIYYYLFFLLIPIFLGAQINVACVGNSITLGFRSTDPYPNQLGVLLGLNYDVNNYGHASTTILKNGEDPYWHVTEHSHAIGYPRDIVVIMFGTNATRPVNWDDHSDEFEDDYISLINEFKLWDDESHQTQFILGLPPPIYTDNSSWGVRNNVLEDEVIPKIKSVANQIDAKTIDFYNKMSNHPEWFNDDSLHPNAIGDSVIAKLVYDAIKNLGNTGSEDPPPEAPKGLKTIPQLTSIDLKWNSNQENNIWRYRIYRADSEYGFQNIIGETIAPDTTFTDNNVVLDQVYYYAIDAENYSGARSDKSALVPGKTYDQIPPANINDLSVALDADSIKLDWSPNIEDDLSRYYIYRHNDQAKLQEAESIISTVYPPLSSFNDVDFISGENYYYGVKALDVSGNQSTVSNIVYVTAQSRPFSGDTTIVALEDLTYSFSNLDFPFSDGDDDSLSGIILLGTNNWNYFQYEETTLDSTIYCDDLTKLQFIPDSNDFGEGYAEFSFRVIDSFGSTSIDTNIAIINVLSVNDEPTLDPIDDLYVTEDTSDILIPISGISSGQIEEIQNLSIKVIPADSMLFSASQIQYSSPDSAGHIIVNPLENVFGSRYITIRVIDDGGTENDGINYTDESFYLYITPRNDPPLIDLNQITIYEDIDTTLTINGIYAGPWESGQNVSISVKSDNTGILPNPTLTYFNPDTFVTLTFETIPNVHGTTSLTAFMSDDGGTELGGMDTISYTIPIEIIAINDSPSDFSIMTPSYDSTLVVNKFNLDENFIISWEVSEDIENDDISYSIIFSDYLSKLSRHGLINTSYKYTLRDMLSVTDTITIASDSYTVIATDGELETNASNSNLKLSIDGRIFAPAELNLDQNFPNPFNHSTIFGFDLPKKSAISLSIFNLLGKEVIRLVENKTYGRGYNTVTWNGLDENYNHVSAGIYIVQIKMGDKIRHKKLLLVK